jgi:hypothetical protein
MFKYNPGPADIRSQSFRTFIFTGNAQKFFELLNDS